MPKHRYFHTFVAGAAAISMVLAGLGGAAAMHSSKAATAKIKGPIIIGQITSLSGAFSVYGSQEVDGFHVGLEYATHGTMKVDGASIQVKQYNDAPSGLPDAPTAVTDAKTAIQTDHAQILQCCASSASALAVAPIAEQFKKILMAAPAATDGISGINRYTFRTSREDTQDAITGSSYAVKHFGKNYMTMAQDYAFGHGQVTSWKTQLKRFKGHDVGDVFFPLTATDFTPYISQIMSKKPKWLFVACAGTQCLGLWKQLDSQGLLAQVKVMTGLPNVAAIPFFGTAGTKMGFISVYYNTFPHTKANTYLVKNIKKLYSRPADIFDQDSFAAAQQLVKALKKTHSTSAKKLIKALEGQSVNGPKGKYIIRKADHVCLQPMYVAKLTGSKLKPVLLATKSPKATAPPLQAHF